MRKKFQLNAIAILVVQLIIAGAGYADISVELIPSAQQNVKNFPYRSATLKIQNDTSREFSIVQIQNQNGGPTFIYPAVILPDEETTLAINIPAVSLTQTYNLALLADDKSDASAIKLTARINWPAELLTRKEFIDPDVYKAHGQALPRWPAKLKRILLITMAAGIVVLVTVLLIPQPSLRTALLIPAVIGLTFILANMLSKKTPIIQILDQGEYMIITSRRTCDIALGKLPKGSKFPGQLISQPSLPIPIYQAEWQMREDEMIIRPNHFATLKIRPDEVRIFCKRQKQPIDN